MLTRPSPAEYADFYADYVARVPEGDLIKFLIQQEEDVRAFMRDLTEEEAGVSPAPGKWSVKQVLGHLCDTERVMSYRALRFARGDRKELQGFEQDDYVREGNFNARTRYDLSTEFKFVRSSTAWLFSNLSQEAMLRTGIANGNPVSVRALGYIIAGHAQRHLELMQAHLDGRSSEASAGAVAWRQP